MMKLRSRCRCDTSGVLLPPEIYETDPNGKMRPDKFFNTKTQFHGTAFVNGRWVRKCADSGLRLTFRTRDLGGIDRGKDRVSSTQRISAEFLISEAREKPET
jgi:hypothetical protein